MDKNAELDAALHAEFVEEERQLTLYLAPFTEELRVINGVETLVRTPVKVDLAKVFPQTPILHVTGWDGPHDEKTRAIPLLPGLYGFSGK